MNSSTESGTKWRIVIDANTVVSAILVREGFSATVFELMIEDCVENFTSQKIVEETKEVLARPELVFRMNENRLMVMNKIFLKKSILVNPILTTKIVEEDETDDKIVHCAIAANAHYNITGDPHLLKIGKYLRIEMITAKKFLERHFPQLIKESGRK